VCGRETGDHTGIYLNTVFDLIIVGFIISHFSAAPCSKATVWLWCQNGLWADAWRAVTTYKIL